jgi:antitoxin PrlF
MDTMTLTAKGQFTFNKRLLEHIGVKAGDKVLVKKLPDGSLKIQAQKSAVPVSALFGCIETELHFTTDEINAAIRKGYASCGAAGLGDKQ